MKTVKSWHTYFLDLAKTVATRSKDPNTNVGAVIVNSDKSIVETGYNGFAPGVAETDERWERPIKYDYVIHAEQNAIAHAARVGIALEGATLYCQMTPCYVCAKMIINSGIERVVARNDYHAGARGKEIFAEAGVAFELLNNETEKYENQ